MAPLEIEHIEDWSRVQRHDFENMIVLCANCHRRKGSGRGQIDRRALIQYKANLAIINNRYGDLERRVLEYYAEMRHGLKSKYPADIVRNWLRSFVVFLPGTMRLLMMRLVRDGYIEAESEDISPFNVVILPNEMRASPVSEDEIRKMAAGFSDKIDCYRLTPTGIELVAAWSDAQPIEPSVLP